MLKWAKPSGRWLQLTLALLFILSINLFLSPEFFHLELKNGRLYGSLIDVMNRSAPCALVALGMSLVIATGGVDLSVGAIVAISGSVCASLLNGPLDAVLLVVTSGLFCGLLLGAVNGSLVSLFGIQPFIGTLVLMVTGRGIAQLVNGGQVITFQNEDFSSIGVGSILWLPSPVVIVAFAFVAIHLLTRRSVLGLLIEACGFNAKASYYAGVNVKSITIFVYCLSGLFAALAGIIITADIQGADANSAGLWLELDAILAVTLGGASLAGGRFCLLSTLLSVLIIQATTTTFIMSGLDARYGLLIKSLIVLLVLLSQSPAFRKHMRQLINKPQGGGLR